VPKQGKPPKQDPISRNEQTLSAYKKYRTQVHEIERKKNKELEVSQHEVMAANLVSKTMYLE